MMSHNTEPRRESSHSARHGTLTNFRHFDFLCTTVVPPAQKNHTTWRLDQEPEIGVIWTYAECRNDGRYVVAGGGPWNRERNAYSQGAFNADDIARSAVVRLRHWVATGSLASRKAAYQLLRGLTYLQTSSGRSAGNVVLWMQPDGCLQPSAVPRDVPDPSDNGPSFWLARAIWALGEAVRAFQSPDPLFAKFLSARLELAIRIFAGDLDRQRHITSPKTHERPQFVVDQADATAEAMFGLLAYLEVSNSAAARDLLVCFAERLAEMSTQSVIDWPYGAILPSARHTTTWHAWGSQMATALCGAAEQLKRPDLLMPAVRDSVLFTSHLLISGGPDNSWSPAPLDRSQIPYGADSRFQAVMAVARSTECQALRRLAEVAGAWYFGLNTAHKAMYDIATGRAYDGISAEGLINQNAGAESTIHTLLSMLVFDKNPDLALSAQALRITDRRCSRFLDASAAKLFGGAHVVNGFGGRLESEVGAIPRSHIRLPRGGWADFGVVADQGVIIQVVWGEVHEIDGEEDRLRESLTWDGGWSSYDAFQGAHATEVRIDRLPDTLSSETPLIIRHRSLPGISVLHGVIVQPPVESLTLESVANKIILLRNLTSRTQNIPLMEEYMPASVCLCGSSGRLWNLSLMAASARTIPLPSGGFALVEYANR
jgi:hypothetical protein